MRVAEQELSRSVLQLNKSEGRSSRREQKYFIEDSLCAKLEISFHLSFLRRSYPMRCAIEVTRTAQERLVSCTGHTLD
jgi:hypothetical protein